MASVLVLASDPIGYRMAGTGIRYWNLAQVLAQEHNVTLAAPAPVDIDAPRGVNLQWFDPTNSAGTEVAAWQAELIAEHSIILGQDIPYYHLDEDVLVSRHIIIDLYAPAILEKLEYARVDPQRGEADRADDVRSLNRLLRLGDFFICASERQRDFWLGALAVAGRVDLEHTRANPELRTLIDVVPYGLPSTLARKNGPGPRSLITGIGNDDLVLLWNGGLWPWLDPLTAIRAVAGLRGEIPHARLIFMGTQSPLHGDRTMDMVDEAKRCATELGVLDRHVYFNDWVPYDERQNWLMDADAAISLHQPTAEARFSFRTRMLDLFWTRLPAIASQGDILADLVDDTGAGITVPTNDVAAVQEAIRTVGNPGRRSSMQAALHDLANQFTWDEVAQPLLHYCRNPERVATERGADPRDAYIHRLEQQYTETVEYARHLERSLVEQREQFESGLAFRITDAVRRLITRKH